MYSLVVMAALTTGASAPDAGFSSCSVRGFFSRLQNCGGKWFSGGGCSRGGRLQGLFHGNRSCNGILSRFQNQARGCSSLFSRMRSCGGLFRSHRGSSSDHGCSAATKWDCANGWTGNGTLCAAVTDPGHGCVGVSASHGTVGCAVSPGAAPTLPAPAPHGHGFGGPSCYVNTYGHWHGACFGCNGCAGSLWQYGSTGGFHAPVHGTILKTEPGTTDPKEEKPKMPPATMKQKESARFVAKSNRARLIVKLPSDAIFYMDGRRMKSRGSRRTFRTPELDHGQLYYYELKVEWKTNGKLLTRSKRVEIQAGEELTVSFSTLKKEAVGTVASR